MKLESLSVRQQLILAFSLLAAMVLLVSLLGLRAMASGHDDFADYVGQTSHRGRLVNDLIDATNARAVSARNLVLVTQDSDRSAEKTAVTQAHDKVLTQLAALKKALEQTPDADARERKLFAEVEAIEASYGRVALDIVRMALEGQHDAAIGKMNSECRPLLAKLLATTGEYLKHLDTHAVVELKEAEASYLWNRSAMLVFCGLAIGLALLLSWRITAALLRALGAEPAALREAAQRVADGDLSPVTGGGDAPQRSVLSALSRMQQDLARVVARVRQASESIATGTAQIATGNADLSQRTEEQASSLQQTAASMEQLSTTVKHNAATAQLATQLAGGASSAATQGGALVTQVVATMGSISESSRRIADIIGTIDGIAFQTNILALNAAVEAARAGEQGRGFAVVAGEVRNLAQRSASAAREIKGLIGDSVERVEAGSRLVNQAGTGMDDIVNQVRRVAELISEISQASSEQTGGIDQVSNAVQLLDQTTQQNAALVEQSAAASESLRQQTTALTEVVRSFKLDASLQLST